MGGQFEQIGDMPDTLNLLPSALYQKSRMKDHENEGYFQEFPYLIKLVASSCQRLR